MSLGFWPDFWFHGNIKKISLCVSFLGKVLDDFHKISRHLFIEVNTTTDLVASSTSQKILYYVKYSIVQSFLGVICIFSLLESYSLLAFELFYKINILLL